MDSSVYDGAIVLVGYVFEVGNWKDTSIGLHRDWL
jgi:hypothetical protein